MNHGRMGVGNDIVLGADGQSGVVVGILGAGGDGGDRRWRSFANLQGKCRFQVASRAQLPGTGWARAGMKFRLV